MSMLKLGVRRRIIAALFAITGLLVHMAWDAVPALRAAQPDTALTQQQKQFFAELRKARAQALMAGERVTISVDDHLQRVITDVAQTEPASLPERRTGDTTADDCPGCLSEYDPLKGLANAPNLEQFVCVHNRVAGLPPLADPKWSRAHMLFDSRAPPVIL